MSNPLAQQHRYLAQLMEAIQRCAWFLAQSQRKLTWPIPEAQLAQRNKDAELFETLAAINERFAKLQDTLAATMRHTALLMGENSDNFLKVLTTFEKWGVIASNTTWQQCRVVRNMAAHDYDLDYAAIAEHFNTLHELTPFLLQTSRKLLLQVQTNLSIQPATGDFSTEFEQLFQEQGGDT